ncbi:MAG: hypothetical protein HQ567_29620 [Candidatus Nealsonbacteria bacterium]|nr:hypothetical protein [Candidatus Nealsonbacteria bacterium]
MNDPESNANDEPDEAYPDADVAEILKDFGVLKRSPSDELPADRTAAEILLDAITDRENAGRFLDSLLPDGIPVGTAFYDRLDSLRRWISIGDSAGEAIGILWSEAIGRLDSDLREELLNIFVSQSGGHFFENLEGLRVVLADHDFPVGYLAEWLPKVGKAVQRDMMQDGFWNAVEAYCAAHVSNALKVIWVLVNTPEHVRLNLAGVMLGTIRPMEMDKPQNEDFERVEAFLKLHEDSQLRSVFDWSWVTMSRKTGITKPQLDSLLTRGDGGREDDRCSVVSVVCCILRNKSLSPELFDIGNGWIEKNLGPSLSSVAKYHVANTAAILNRSSDDPNRGEVDCTSWVTAIQPVSAEDMGTWEQIERFLYNLLKTNSARFCDVFEQLCSLAADTLHQLMSKPRTFELLLREMNDADLANLVGRLALSWDTPTRCLGVFLFDQLDVEEIPESSLAAIEDLDPRLLFYELQRSAPKPEANARMLVSLIPHLDEADTDFCTEFYDEVKLQAQNFAGAFRSELEKRVSGLPAVTKVLEEVAAHFDELQRVHEAGMNAMEVTGHRRGIVLHHRRFSQEASESMKEYSPFLGMIKQVQQLYGRSASTFIDGRLQDSIPLVPISSSFEMPMVELCDPEHMVMRRIRAANVISSLLEEHSGNMTEAGNE